MQGEAYINRAAQLQTQTKNDDLQIIYKVCQGRVLDYKRKFIEAASRLTKTCSLEQLLKLIIQVQRAVLQDGNTRQRENYSSQVSYFIQMVSNQ